MFSIYMILTALTTAALGKGTTECNFSKPIDGQQCFGAVGQPLIFYLPAAADRDIRLKKDEIRIKLTKDNKNLILKVKNQTVISCENDYISQYGGYNSGTLNFGNAMKNHSGDYTLEEYKLDGVSVKNTNVRLQLQVPVSEPVVSQVCVSPEQMKVSCSSDGEEVEFTLTLYGHSPLQTRDQSLSFSTRTSNPSSPTGEAAEQNKSSVSSVSISLHGQVTGDLMCNVQNKVSRNQTVLHLTSCKGESKASLPVVTVAVKTTVISLVLVTLCLGLYHLHYKTRNKTVREGISKDSALWSSVTYRIHHPQKTSSLQ